jgi:SAM-dependent methyltransferase
MPKVAVKARPKLEVVEKPVQICIGYAPSAPEGFTIVDTYKHEKVDKVFDPAKKWDWANDSVDEVVCGNFLQRLTAQQRVHFFNELYRVLKPGKQARIVTPHWSHEKYYAEPDVQWPPVTAFTYFYLSKQWREVNAPRFADAFKCEFEWVLAGSHDQNDEWVAFRTQEVKQVYMHRNINTTTELIATLTKPAKKE